MVFLLFLWYFNASFFSNLLIVCFIIRLSFFFKTLTLLGAGVSLFISLQYFQAEELKDFEYTLLLLF